ncbi:MAG: type II toxin-antitoxin system RelE/ParE family toxin [Candidatus Melainabacteria bacterium]
MIITFGNKLASALFHGEPSKETRRFPQLLRRAAVYKLSILHAADLLDDLLVPPGNRLEALKGDFKGFHSIRINDQWRLVFRWDEHHAYDVQIIDYH